MVFFSGLFEGLLLEHPPPNLENAHFADLSHTQNKRRKTVRSRRFLSATPVLPTPDTAEAASPTADLSVSGPATNVHELVAVLLAENRQLKERLKVLEEQLQSGWCPNDFVSCFPFHVSCKGGIFLHLHSGGRGREG